MSKLTLRALKDSFKLSKRFVLVSLLAGLFSALYPLISIYISQRVIHELTTQSDLFHLMRFISLALAGVFISQIISGVANYVYAFERSDFHMQLEIARNLKSIDMEFQYVEDPAIKDLRRRITIVGYGGATSFEQVAYSIKDVVNYLVSIIGASYFIFPAFLYRSGGRYDSPLYLLALLAMLMLFAYIPHRFNQRQNAKLVQTFSEANESNSIFNYIMNLLFKSESGKEIRLYKQQPWIYQWFEKNTDPDGFTGQMLKFFARAVGNTQIISTAGNQLVMAFLYLLIGLKAITGELPLAHIVAATAALNILIGVLPDMVSLISLGMSDSAGLQMHYQYMDLPNQTLTGSIPVEMRLDNEYHLSVSNLSFRYPGTDRDVLRDINLAFEVGKSYAIVGENGSGKTTFIKLLTRLYDPTQGEVRLNNIAANKYDSEQYYQLFNVVFQDFDLFSFRLGETIATGSEYDAEQIVERLRQVSFYERYTKMPHGLETSLNKEFDRDGVILSGGEQQKLAFARALYNNGPIYVLDEPTAALDPISEFEIYRQFHELTAGRTALIISHRLSSCRFCDEILVFDHGRIVQQGTHEELVNQPGKYAELWWAQAKHYQAEKLEVEKLGISAEVI